MLDGIGLTVSEFRGGPETERSPICAAGSFPGGDEVEALCGIVRSIFMSDPLHTTRCLLSLDEHGGEMSPRAEVGDLLAG